MSKTFRAIILILLTTAVLFIFMSCNAEQTSKGNNPTQNDKSASSDDDKSGPPLIKADYGETDFRLLNFVSYGDFWKIHSYSEVQAEMKEGDPIDDAFYKRNLAVEEMYNVKIKEIRHGEPTDGGDVTINKTVRLVQAGEDEFDAALSTGRVIPTVIAGNMTIDLLSIPELDLTQPWWNQNAVKEYTLANKLHMATGDITMWHTMAVTVFYFNKKLMQDCGLENPYELVRNNEWTWDKFGEMARGAAMELNGDGKFDRNDQVGVASEGGSMPQAIFCAGEHLITKDENDLPVININLDRANTIVDKVLSVLRNDEYAYTTDDLYGRFKNPFYEFSMPKFRNDQMLFYTQQLMIALELREMEADFGVLPFPKLDKNQAEYYSYATDNFLKYTWIPTTSTNPGRAATLLQAFGYYSREYVTPAFMEITITNKALRDEESLEMLNIIMNNRFYDLALIYNWENIQDIYVSIYSKKRNDLASAYESNLLKIENAMQKTIDELSD